jgi:hypothetical protein
MSAFASHAGTGGQRKRDIYTEVQGRELEVLSCLGISPPASGKHIRCPFPDHADNNPSWRWCVEKSCYFCTCGSGHIVDAVMQMLGLSFKDAAAWIREEVLDEPAREPKYANGGGQKAKPNGHGAAPKDTTAYALQLVRESTPMLSPGRVVP